MQRFFGMMPSTEIEIEKYYKDNNGYEITIQAGLHGWTIIYADSSSEFKDVNSSADENFKDAYNVAINRLGTLVEITNGVCKQQIMYNRRIKNENNWC